ncbi:protein of unknown function [Taphrina deformans PYCC 5710]|uniref:TLC domain-containing protein n=1 Tax=Taphrina deformans (strain PYCC 5710 / ATCC 11124 / CBS 356.35 / IMI 108563 / JCM 9778 / NBRC 8474) TaxID=1097556 RepID=R4X975_TAPDE|nr:protein of unknown function [Taphrina deformans PYCC 5710]|eukprot:CCG82266.1 protein of unknown function [Taphrina deformans PYCC 5710]
MIQPYVHGERRSTLYAYTYVIVINYLIALWCLCRFLIEPYVMPKLLGKKYTEADEGQKRTMTNHVVNILWKCSTLFGLYPFIMTVVLGKPSNTYLTYGNVTYGDMLALAYMLFSAGFIFELIYRSRISFVTALHHLVALFISTIVSWMIVARVRGGMEGQAELHIIFTYGVFEIFFETGPHVMMILYKRYRNRQAMLKKGFLFVALWSFTGTFLEQFAIGYLYIHNWAAWDMSLKVLTPILHCCFAAAQVHGGRVFLALSRKMAREYAESLKNKDDLYVLEPQVSFQTVATDVVEKKSSGVRVSVVEEIQEIQK